MDLTIISLVLISTILFILIPQLLWGTLMVVIIYGLGQFSQKVLFNSTVNTRQINQFNYLDSLN